MGHIVYRRGTRSSSALTPRPPPVEGDPWKTDDTTGPKRGLSVYRSLDEVPAGTRTVAIDLDLLVPPLALHQSGGHLAIVPKIGAEIDDASLAAWAAAKRADEPHAFTLSVLRATIDDEGKGKR
jgi:hypothetical protein